MRRFTLRSNVAVALFFVILLGSSTNSVGADIWPNIHGNYRDIVIEGEILPGDFDTFIRIIQENQGKVSGITIFSPGGDFYEAMKVGRAMRALELGSTVPVRDQSGRPTCWNSFDIQPHDPKNCTCGSAAFFIHIGSVYRAGTFLAVHRPYFDKKQFGKLSEADAKKAFDKLQESARNYMQEMGVPQHIQEEVLATPSDRALILDDKTVKAYFLAALPYRQEWVRSRCASLSDSQRRTFETYLDQLGKE